MVIGLIFLLGLAIGSFLNVVILRLKAGQSLLGRSKCPACQKTLSWFELIPLVSFFWQKGRCRSCQAPISWQYPVVEFSTGLLFVLGFVIWRKSLAASQLGLEDFIWLLRDFVFMNFLFIIMVYDLKYFLILDKISIPALLVALIFNLFLIDDFSSLMIGLAVGGVFFFLQYWFSRGRWLGGGDVRLGLVMGAMLGWPGILTALFIAYVSGSLVALPLVVSGKKSWSAQMPLAAFLAPATLATLWFGQTMLDWYLKFLAL